MRRFVVPIVVLSVIVAVGLGGWWFLRQNPEWITRGKEELDKAVVELGVQPEEEPIGLMASGFIEADEAYVTTELGGRITVIHADEGDEVSEDQLLVELDNSLLLAQIEMAKADLVVAEAMLDQIKIGVRQETLAFAESLVRQAEVSQGAALVAWQDAQAMLDNPQDLELALVAARAQLGVLDKQVAQAEALANSAEVGRNLTGKVVEMLEDMEGDTVRIHYGDFYDDIKIRLPGNALPDARYEQAVATYQSWQAWTLSLIHI